MGPQVRRGRSEATLPQAGEGWAEASGSTGILGCLWTASPEDPLLRAGVFRGQNLAHRSPATLSLPSSRDWQVGGKCLFPQPYLASLPKSTQAHWAFSFNSPQRT
jgi:hypothetical protein